MFILVRNKIDNVVKYTMEVITGEDQTPNSAYSKLVDAAVGVAMAISDVHHVMHGLDRQSTQRTTHLVDYARILYDHHEQNVFNTAFSFMIDAKKANGIPILSYYDGHLAGLSDEKIDEINKDYSVVSEGLELLSANLEVDPESEESISSALEEVCSHHLDIEIDNEIAEAVHHEGSEFTDPIEYIKEDYARVCACHLDEAAEPDYPSIDR